MANESIDRILERVDPSKRAFLKRLVVGAAFAAPFVVSFSMDGLSVYDAHAQQGSNTMPSDRNLKEAFAPIDAEVILGKVARLPIETWRYRVSPSATSVPWPRTSRPPSGWARTTGTSIC